MYIENNDKEQYEIAEIVEIMACYLNASVDVDSSLTPYSSKYMKKKLVEKYGDYISISGEAGKGYMVMMQETIGKILRNYHDQPDPLTEEEEKYKIITTAAKLIKSDIKKENKKKCNGKVEHYPLKEELYLENALKYLPESLKCFFKNLFVGKDTSRKIAGIGQSILQAVCPRSSLAPLQLGLSILVYHHYRSEYLLNTLHGLGFCSSYDEIQMFEGNCALVNAAAYLLGDLSGGHVMMVADNVDHNTRTLDGKNTFHGMGMIAAIIPHRSIDRLNPRKKVSLLDISEAASINVEQYFQDKHKLDGIKFKVQSLKIFDEMECLKTDMLWKISWCLPKQRPNYSGFMHLLHSNQEHPGKSNIIYLPMIDLNPSDISCIFFYVEVLTKVCTKQ